jgi:Deltex C-terminal domain/Ring finger domain
LEKLQGGTEDHPASAAREELDLILAASLQEDEFIEHDASTSNLTKAWDFCHRITENHRKLLEYDPDNPYMNACNFSVVNHDDMVFFAERLFQRHEEFAKVGKDVHVDIGYHYTTSKNLHCIRFTGLLSEAERAMQGVTASTATSTTNNGATFGDGIYTGNNPFSYHEFRGGDKCLFVARLKGRTHGVGQSMQDKIAVANSGPDPAAETADTVLGRYGDTDEVCVLKSSSQCVALVTFDSPLVEIYNDLSAGNDMVHAYHCSLQAVIDECFNSRNNNSGSSNTLVPKLFPSKCTLRSWGSAPSQPLVLTYIAPETMDHDADLDRELIESTGTDPQCECSICLNAMMEDVVQIYRCGHSFHRACILESWQVARRCPLCRTPVGIPRGKMPSGQMSIQHRPDLQCTGTPNDVGAIVITYSFGPGIQKSYHENPGVEHDGTTRMAFLPATDEGMAALDRLQFAFQHGLTFTVGISLTSGRSNAITWASIHHKTRTGTGSYGYPDAGYFVNLNEELDSLHVPAAEDLKLSFNINTF